MKDVYLGNIIRRFMCGVMKNRDTEMFGLKRANLLGVSAPKLIAAGIIQDKYDFLYMVT
jgi:hypothetical protein